MPRYIAFLRAVNVGGRIMKMEALREAFESMAFSEVQTFIASGNVIFRAGSTSSATLERRIEANLASAFGMAVDTFLRTDAELAAIATFPAFSDAVHAGAQAYNVGFLKSPLEKKWKEHCASFQTDIDAFRASGRELYWLCQVKQSESTFNNALFERKLKVRATFRSMTTVCKIVAKYGM